MRGAEEGGSGRRSDGRDGRTDGRAAGSWVRQVRSLARSLTRPSRLSRDARKAIDIERTGSCSLAPYPSFLESNAVTLTHPSLCERRIRRFILKRNAIESLSSYMSFAQSGQLQPRTALVAPESRPTRRDGRVDRAVFSLAWETRL